jgi:sodium-dependent phosphate cotransporter
MKKGFSWINLVFLIYLFIFAIELIKRSSLALTPYLKDFLLQNLNPIEAISVGWFTTSIIQSSGAMGSIAAAFAGGGIISLQVAVYILIGAALGSTITAILISIITLSKKRRDFRHGFEIGLCYSLYSALILVVVLILEYFFKLFSSSSLFLATNIGESLPLGSVPNLVDTITSPLFNLFFNRMNNVVLLVLGFLILILTLRFLSRSVIGVFGGEEKTKRFINRHFSSKYKAYLLGFIFTALIFSSGITTGLLVPLAVSRLINLKKAIPFILGAGLGTFTDIFLAAIVIGKVAALATAISFFLFKFAGTLIFLPNTELLFKLTKYTSKKLMGVSRKKALYFLLAFILIPLILIIIF